MKESKQTKGITKLRVFILLTLFIVLFFNFIIFLVYSGFVEVNNFILSITSTLNLFFIIISLLYFIFAKKVVNVQSLFNLYLGGIFSLTSLNDLFITMDMFFQMLSFYKFLNIITTLIIIYISIVLFSLICAKIRSIIIEKIKFYLLLLVYL